MTRIISSIFVAAAFATTAGIVVTTPSADAHGCENGCGGGFPGWGGLGLDLDIDIDLDGDIDLDLGKCFDIEVGLGADCAIVKDLEADLYCNPLSVEAACIAELGVDCGLDAFLDCVADVTAHCEAEVEADGALFCDGVFLGSAGCGDDLGIDIDLGLDIDIDLDGLLDACFDVDLDADVDLDLDICLDVNLGANVECAVDLGLECLAKCSPVAVEAACIVELGEDCSLHEMAACQAGLMAHCQAACNLGGALFCDGDIYAGFFFCE